jgi:hypothetical protein
MLLDWCIALGCLAACFAGGWAFVSSRLLQNYDDKETGVQVCGVFMVDFIQFISNCSMIQCLQLHRGRQFCTEQFVCFAGPVSCVKTYKQSR